MKFPIAKSNRNSSIAKRPSSRSLPLQAATILSVLYLLARVIGLVQMYVIARFLGAGERDAYVAAFRLPDFVSYLVAGGAMSMTFIPIYTELWQSGREREAWRFFSTLGTIAGVVLAILIFVGCIAAHPLVLLFNPGLANRPDVLELTVVMTRILLPAQMFFYFGGMIIGVLNAHKRFSASGWTGAAYNLIAIVVAIALLPWLGPVAFAYGILIGAVLGYFALPLRDSLQGPAVERLKFAPSFDWRNPIVRRFFTNALPIMLGVSFPIVDQIVVNLYASYLPPGSMSNLYIANRVMLAPQSVLAQAASVAAFPYMATDIANRDWSKFSRFLRTGLCRLVFLALPVSVLLILLAHPIIEFLFLHGKMTQADAQETAAAFAFYCVGLFAWTGQQFVARGFYALQDTFTPTAIGSAITVVFFGACFFVVKLGGTSGLAMATSVGAVTHFTCMLLVLDSRLKGRPYKSPLNLTRIASTMLRTVTACLLMGIAGGLLNIALDHMLSTGNLANLVRIVVVGAGAGATFAIAATRFSIPEWTWISGKLMGVAKRKFAKFLP